MAVDAYPLAWPIGWERTKVRQRATFKTSFTNARESLLHELRLMGVGASRVVISTNLELRKDGWPKATGPKVKDPGVAVYFVKHDREFCIPCDKWDTVDDNMQAIRKTVEALRGLERWGAKNMVEAAFAGFEALPERSESGWWVVMDITRDATDQEVERQYRRLVKRWHPDNPGGSDDMFIVMHHAYQEFRQERGL